MVILIIFIIAIICGWASSYFSPLGLVLAWPLGFYFKRALRWRYHALVAIGLLVGAIYTPITMFIGSAAHRNIFQSLVVFNTFGTPLLWLIGGIMYVRRQERKRQLKRQTGW